MQPEMGAAGPPTSSVSPVTDTAASSMQDKIDDLRKERLIFDTIYKKLEREMQELLSEVNDAIKLKVCSVLGINLYSEFNTSSPRMSFHDC